MEKFESTTEGYLLAKEWLMSIGKWEEVSTTGFSTDGYSIVASANALWNMRSKHPSIFLVDEMGHYPWYNLYTGGIDPITSNKGSKGVWTTIPVKPNN